MTAPSSVDYALPTVAFVIVWALAGFVASMVGAKRASVVGFAAGATVAGALLIYLAMRG